MVPSYPLRNTCCVPARRKRKQTQELVHKSFHANWGLSIFPDLWLSMRLEKKGFNDNENTETQGIYNFCEFILVNIQQFQPSHLVSNLYRLLRSWEKKQVDAILFFLMQFFTKGPCCSIRPTIQAKNIWDTTPTHLSMTSTPKCPKTFCGDCLSDKEKKLFISYMDCSYDIFNGENVTGNVFSSMMEIFVSIYFEAHFPCIGRFQGDSFSPLVMCIVFKLLSQRYNLRVYVSRYLSTWMN